MHHAASLEPAQLTGDGVVEVHRVAVAADRRVRRHVVLREPPALAQRVADAQHRRRRRRGRRGGGGGADEGEDCPAAEAHRGGADGEFGVKSEEADSWDPVASQRFLSPVIPVVYNPVM